MTYDISIPDDNYSMFVASSSIVVSNQIHLTIHALIQFIHKWLKILDTIPYRLSDFVENLFKPLCIIINARSSREYLEYIEIDTRVQIDDPMHSMSLLEFS